MTRIQAQIIGDQILLPRSELDRLVEIARKSDEIDVEYCDAETSTNDIMKMAERGKSFDFWHEEGEDVYTAEDGKPV